ncbi:type 2 isopentenyl-diphosphate Delta-isomerase [Poseidonocella sedimentorum]|uniref:Isopentenyl-diphosphate delta-isomerase n=1 Tax=Poseidonocella sedimentorum TaxID=871652 RepID=A0A1I6ER32_9RHOB|nr:type 2 isopentenyl-diphosphate Delta-isomerase [Poseidonocella sedimentorum]SFR20219.1 isopentenyl-diphosphate delta-isomerase [Poseidonocella sedimentorum]
MSRAPDRSTAGRKRDHIRALGQDAGIERGGTGFDTIRLTHRALPELDLDKIDTRTTFLGKELSFPLIISSMTGGEDAAIARINRNLAQAAEATGVAMAVGSQRVMFDRPAARASFAIREFAPHVPLVANIGAVQLNAGLGAAECRAAIDVLEADGLYLHLNPLQEAVQPEGDRDFSGLIGAVAALAPQLPVPVLFKEVGAGLSGADIRAGLEAGIRHFDVAGRGGTSWSRIEYHRRAEEDDDLGLVFQDWGLTTVEALEEARAALGPDRAETTLIASGGIRNGIDMVKALVLGADLCGIAAPLLAEAQESCDCVIRKIQRIRREFQTAMFLLGCADCTALRGNAALVRQD